MSENYILLKWGVLKGWKLNDKCFEHLKRYVELGMSMSSMLQKNTPEHKEALCAMIQDHDGTIQNDWDGEYYTKEQAIDYIINYGKRS